MMRAQTVMRRVSLVFGSLVLMTFFSATASWARQESLLSPSKGEVPNDIGSDTLSTFSIVDSPELGGKALKVAYASGDSIGMRQARVKNWKPFISLQFAAFNPAKEDVHLTLTVRHKRTTSMQTRVDVSIVLKPGKNAVVLGIDKMQNVNGSAPDLADVGRWYINCDEGKTPTLLFGDIVLVGDDAAVPAAGSPAIAGIGGPLRITGKIGDMNVDLTVQALSGTAVPTSPGAARAIATDPARLARIRAAKMPPITQPVMFFTPEADAIVSALEVFPPDNPWNQIVEDWPLHPNSKNIIASIGAEKPFRYNADMGYILVPPNQKRIELKALQYPHESDKGPYPIPDNVPIEDWPVKYKTSTLDDVQRDKANENSDRHACIVDPVNRVLYEFYQMKKVAGGWQAAQASIFDLKTNQLRPDGWTSTDAAGLPIFPATVRYDELKRGMVEHAVRVSVAKSRREYVAPATHYASPHTNEEYPRMGERLRLRRDFDISGFSPEVAAILKGLKKYGMFVADNGLEWAISVTPDPRIPLMHAELRKIKGSDFEVVVPPR